MWGGNGYSGRGKFVQLDATNAQRLLKQKFAMEQKRIAVAFETSSGRCALWTSRRMRMRLPSIETRPLERWKRMSWCRRGVWLRRSRQGGAGGQMRLGASWASMA